MEGRDSGEIEKGNKEEIEMKAVKEDRILGVMAEW